MNKLRIIFISICTLFLFVKSDLDAQTVLDRRGQAIYFELLGQGFIYSINYESRFSRKTGGLGGRIGFSYLTDWVSLPINVNYLLGKPDKSHFLELGFGTTFLFYGDEPQTFDGKLYKRQAFIATTIMYRYHPRFKKFFFKFGMTPLYGFLNDGDEEKGWIPFFGIAIGRAF